MSALPLYHYWRSSASWRVRWALEIKKVDFEPIAVNLLESAESQPEYREKNPAGYVPCLITGKGAIAESIAILEWLEENFEENPLLPKDSFLRARARQLAETVNAGIQPLQNISVIKKLSSDPKVQAEWTQHWIVRGLEVFEDILSRTRRENKLEKSQFCLGDSPSFADICLIPQCYSAMRFGVDLEKFSLSKKIYEYSLSTYECGASHPERYKPSA